MIIIYAEGGGSIGMGHLARTSVLAKELAKFTEVKYICSNKYQEGIDFIEQKGFEVIRTQDVYSTLLKIEAECLITDHYGIDQDYINTVRKHFPIVGYIDDNAEKSYQADFILNQNYGIKVSDYKTSMPCKLLLGPQYILVRDEFREVEPITIHETVKNIFVTIGGSDAFNLMEGLVEKLYLLPYEFYIVIGASFPYQSQVIEKYKNRNNIHFSIMPKISELAKVCDIAISSCGVTLYELGLLGVPTLGITLADNQEPLAGRMHRDKLIRYLGKIEDLTSEQLRMEVNALAGSKERRLALQNINIKMINGYGVKEVAKYIKDRLISYKD